MARILGLDVSTKTIGIALFEEDGKLLELTHITPVIKPKPETKLEELFKKVDAFEKLLTRYIELDIEKVVIEEPLLIKEASKRVGSQSVAVVLDIKRVGLLKNKFQIYSHNSKKSHKLEVNKFIQEIESLGAGEIIINSIDKDGTRSGYDFELVSTILKITSLPVTFIGGANDINDISTLVNQYGPIGAAAGSMFVFKGKYRAVLIQYPSNAQMDSIFKL